MDQVRRAIAKIVEQHLDEILNDMMDAYDAALPSVANARDDVRAQVRESARRTTVAFIALYADPGSPARTILDEARRVTLDRSGELFEREEIVLMLKLARQVMYQSARGYVREALEVDPALEGEIDGALESFMSELERAERIVPRSDDAVQHLLVVAEREGPDLG